MSDRLAGVTRLTRLHNTNNANSLGGNVSKQIPAQIKCPSCDEKIKTKLYRSIWIEDPKNRVLIFQDKINTVTCPSCNKETFIEYPFLCTNVEKEIAIWYEPYHDPEIDNDIDKYKSHMGINSFYAKAPRIKDWEEFKEKIIEYEGIKSNANKFEVSKEMNDAFSGFIGHIKKENQKNKYPKYLRHLWNTRKDLRLWVFGSAVWIVGVLLYVIMIGPYSNSRRNYMNADEFLHMFMVMLLPPLFVGTARYVYEKYIS